VRSKIQNYYPNNKKKKKIQINKLREDNGNNTNNTNEIQRIIIKYFEMCGRWGRNQVVGCLPRMHKALNLNSNTTKIRVLWETSVVWWHIPIFPELQRLRWENHKVKVILGYILRPCFKKFW
jgi:hypothetical protein